MNTPSSRFCLHNLKIIGADFSVISLHFPFIPFLHTVDMLIAKRPGTLNHHKRVFAIIEGLDTIQSLLMQIVSRVKVTVTLSYNGSIITTMHDNLAVRGA